MTESEYYKKWNINHYTQMMLLVISLIFAVMLGVTSNILYLLGWAICIAASHYYKVQSDKYYELTVKEINSYLDRR